MNTKSRKADTGALIKRIGYRWILLLICGFLFGFLWCGYKYMGFKKDAAAALASEHTESFSNYDAYTKEISRLNDRITSQQKHMDSSILADIDPDNAPEAVESIIVNSDQNDSTVLADSLRTYIANGIDWGKAAKAMNIDSARNISELVVTDEYNYNFSDIRSNEIRLTVFGKDEDSALKLMKYINEDITKNFENYIGINGITNNIRMSEINVTTRSDYYLVKWYDNQIATITNLIDRRTKLQTGQATANNSSNVVMPTFGKKKVVRYFLTGFVSGVIIGAVLAALYLLAKGYVLSEEEIADQFDINLLGRKLTDEDHSKDKLVDHRLASKPYQSKLSEKERYLLAVNDIRNALNAGDKKVAVLTDLDQSVSDHVISELSCCNKDITFNAIDILNESPETQKALSEVDDVVILAGVEVSRYQKVNKIIYNAVKNKKSVLGVLIY